MAVIRAVSVVIPLFNKAPYIARALSSVLTQTFKDFEVIVVDDGSTDDGAEVVKGFEDPRIRLIHQNNCGVSVTRNRGVKEATGELIAFLDADDEWLPDHLETLIRLRKKFPEAGIYTTTYFVCTKFGEVKGIKLSEMPGPPWEGIIPSYFLAAAQSFNMPISTSSVGLPKNIFEKFGGFRIGLNMFEDSEFWGKLALKYPIAFSWQGGSIYHFERENRLSSRKIDFEHPFVKIAENAIRDKEISPTVSDDLMEYIAKLKINYALRNIVFGKNKIARDILIHCDTKKLKFMKYQSLLISFLPRTVFLIILKTYRFFMRGSTRNN